MISAPLNHTVATKPIGLDREGIKKTRREDFTSKEQFTVISFTCKKIGKIFVGSVHSIVGNMFFECETGIHGEGKHRNLIRYRDG